MLFTWTFYLASIICCIGVCAKIHRWFSGVESAQFAIGSVFQSLFSGRLFSTIRAFCTDVLLQTRIFRRSRFRWAMHGFVFFGFLCLLLFHALENQVSREIFNAYEPTLNPYMFLRNFFGVLVLAGLAMAWYRRRTKSELRRLTRFSDRFLLWLIAGIILSGFALESVKIASEPVFDRMVEDYAQIEGEERDTLAAYWARDFGVVFSSPLDDTDTAVDKGKEVHESYCADCHVRPEWAFVSYPAARLFGTTPIAVSGISWDQVFWYLHFLCCFAALALLPFTKSLCGLENIRSMIC